MSSRIPVIFLDLWSTSELYEFFRSNPYVMQIIKNDTEIGLLIPKEIMEMQNPIVENFKKKSLDTFTGLYSHIVCWRVPSPEIPF